jgi:hypothetical protein
MWSVWKGWRNSTSAKKGQEIVRNRLFAYESRQSSCAAMPIMARSAEMTSYEKIRVIDVDRFDNGVVVSFSDGQSVLYHAQFLYEVREHDGNRPVREDESLDEAKGT